MAVQLGYISTSAGQITKRTHCLHVVEKPLRSNETSHVKRAVEGGESVLAGGSAERVGAVWSVRVRPRWMRREH